MEDSMHRQRLFSCIGWAPLIRISMLRPDQITIQRLEILEYTHDSIMRPGT